MAEEAKKKEEEERKAEAAYQKRKNKALEDFEPFWATWARGAHGAVSINANRQGKRTREHRCRHIHPTVGEYHRGGRGEEHTPVGIQGVCAVGNRNVVPVAREGYSACG